MPNAPAPAPGHVLDPQRLGEHLDRLNAVAVALCGSRHEAEDLVQDTLVKVLRCPRHVHGDDFTYLTVAVRNTFFSRRRRDLARPSTVSLPDTLDGFDVAASPSVEGAVLARELMSAVARLPAPMRDALVSVHVAGYNCRDTARLLGVREGTIMSRCFRARERLAPLLEVA
jgi:RNA polymerase sigma-70 factor, ECF subfamily